MILLRISEFHSENSSVVSAGTSCIEVDVMQNQKP